jgi:ABC-type transporter Mla subunit MlaD
LENRITELTRQLNQKDAELDQEVADAVEGTFDEVDQDIEAGKKELRDGLRQKVEAIKEGVKDRKDGLRQKVEATKKAAKDRTREEAEDALNAMEEDISQGDLVSAHINRWTANMWLKASK